MPARPHVRFAAAVARRQRRVLSVEASAVGLAVFAVVAAPLARWVGPTWAAVGGPVALAAAVWRLTRRWPTARSAAAAADRRFGWDDLLSTALTAGPPADPFAAAVATAADARCGRARPSDVPAARLGRRAWAVAALAAIAAVGTATVPPRSGPPSAADEADAAALVADAVADAVPEATIPPPPTRTPRAADPSDDRRLPPTAEESPPPSSGAPAARSASAAAASGGGGGHASSPSRTPADGPPTAAGTARAGDSPPAGGGGSTVRTPQGTDAAPGGTAAQPSPASPPWQSPDWPAARRSAAAAVAAGTVPAADRDLVGAYFDPANGRR